MCDFLLPPLHGHGKCGPLIPGKATLSLKKGCQYAVSNYWSFTGAHPRPLWLPCWCEYCSEASDARPRARQVRPPELTPLDKRLTILLRTPLGKITNRHIPLSVFGLTFLLWAIGAVEGSYCTMFGTGLIVSWVYLRFYQVATSVFTQMTRTYAGAQ